MDAGPTSAGKFMIPKVEVGKEPIEVTQVSFAIVQANPIETYLATPPTCIAPPTHKQARWAYGFTNMHKRDYDRRLGYAFGGLAPGFGALLGQKTFERTWASPGFFIDETSTWTDKTTIRVVHAPITR